MQAHPQGCAACARTFPLCGLKRTTNPPKSLALRTDIFWLKWLRCFCTTVADPSRRSTNLRALHGRTPHNVTDSFATGRGDHIDTHLQLHPSSKRSQEELQEVQTQNQQRQSPSSQSMAKTFQSPRRQPSPRSSRAQIYTARELHLVIT